LCFAAWRLTQAALDAGADPNVIAVTATDVDDKLFTGANRGKYISVAAPGVDILVSALAGQSSRWRPGTVRC
jgi:hypothetical protein